MRGPSIPTPYRRFPRWVAGSILLAACSAGLAPAQTAPAADPGAAGKVVPAIEVTSTPPGAGVPDSGIVQAGCASCGGGAGSLCGPGAPGSGGCGTCCLPGRNYCCGDCDCDTKFGRFFCGFYQCICCPDPCYEPCWLAVADQAFFLDAARPITQMKLRYDTSFGIQNPDRAEYYWARERTTPNQLGPGGPCAKGGIGKGPPCVADRLEIESLSLYMEGAVGGFGIFIETPYEHIDPKGGAAEAALEAAHPGAYNCCPASGFGDLIIGTKSMLLDCPLMQITFQFKTILPTGNFTTGLGTGHTSLEPSLLFNICCSPSMYLQGQLAYWIAVGGDPLYEGNIFHQHLSLNRILCKPCPGVQVIANIEFNNWAIQSGGAYTETDTTATVNGVVTPVSHAAHGDFASIGPGIRAILCDKIDFGVGTAFAVTTEHWAEEEIRAEFRWRF